MKKAKITFFLLILLTVLIFYIINKMTVSPGTSSGNGNPALLIALILLPIFIIMVTLWVYIFRAHSIQVKFSIVCITAVLIHLIVAFTYQKKGIRELPRSD